MIACFLEHCKCFYKTIDNICVILYDIVMDNKQYNRVTIYFTKYLHEKVKKLAEEEERTLSSEIRHLIRKGIESKDRKNDM